MTREALVAVLSSLSAASNGAFRGRDAVKEGVARKYLRAFVDAEVIERLHPDTYRMTAVADTPDLRRRASLLWAGGAAAAAGRSAGEVYGLEGVRAVKPEIAVARRRRLRSRDVIVHRPEHAPALMLRNHRGWRVTGVEATLVALATDLDPERFEIACEDARRRGLTSCSALSAYVDRFGRRGVSGTTAVRSLLRDLDPVHPARSTLEVKTRRLLVANGLGSFVREFPLAWNGRTWHYDFAFPHSRTILETNGRRWHDDPNDFERDNEKWSVPAHHGYRIVFATWTRVTKRPGQLIDELTTALNF